jgi:hypothetical protein
LAFAAATLAVDGAKLGVGEMLRVSLVGVAGTGVGVIGLLRDVGAVVLLVGVVLLLDVVPVPSVAFRSDAARGSSALTSVLVLPCPRLITNCLPLISITFPWKIFSFISLAW